MTKRNRIIYLTATGLLTANMLLSAGMYFLNYPMVAEMFESLSYPTYIIYPLAIAKILGLVAIWSNKSKMLKEWAYAGFVFELLLAISAHINAEDGGFLGPMVALVFVIVSYYFYRNGSTNNAETTSV